jgi:hypothetical protein
MEEEFKGELAVIWGVEDEDDLPDNLQVRMLDQSYKYVNCLTLPASSPSYTTLLPTS